ncbi:MAG TPA: S41 family peptidase, partial [Thermoanaerobaculia bacterium]|nr:S41 family peptidase [Thermoanaerobaculia bacterium]
GKIEVLAEFFGGQGTINVPCWSPDGRKIAFISDRTGEEEVWLVDQDGGSNTDKGASQPEQLTRGGKAMRYAPEWAPDGKRIAFGDKDGKLYVLTVADRKLVEVADERHGTMQDYVWSPDGGHLALSLADDNLTRSLWIWSVSDGKLRRVTDERFDEFNPTWDPQGKYLFYLSNRDYSPQADFFDYNYAIVRNTGIYAMALRRDVGHPFPPESDEVTLSEEEKKDEAEKKEGAEGKDAVKPASAVRIDFDGLSGRVARVPVPFGNYSGLAAKDGHLLYFRGGAFFFDGSSDDTVLQIFSMKDRKETTLAEKVDGYSLSQDGGKVLIVKEGGHHLLDATPGGKDSGKPISTAGLVVDRVPAEEWAEVFDEAWRRYRDFFYVENMHGYDWEALREQYRPLLAHVGHRSDLNYILGEMIGELNISHAYVAGGDFQLPPRPRVALPGARFELDKAAGRYRVTRIFSGENEEDLYRSPLTELGVDVRPGDYVLAVDGIDLPANDNPYRLLRHKSGQPVRLTVNSRPSYEGAREAIFQPVSSEANLVYLQWVKANRERVDKLSGGRVGYLHIPDMGGDGLREFIKAFYPQLRKEGLVIDVRSNGGGFVSAMILDRLQRVLRSVDFSRLDDSARTYPPSVFHGHMVCLMNETTSSDGDVFAAMFKQAGLGPLIGKRTWGGVVGITGHGPMIDGGQISVPESGSASPDGQWIIEGHGVDPDIEVDNDPKSLLAGRDPQLERGVAEVLKAIEKEPRKLPARPAPPVKTQAGMAGSGG